MAMDAGREKREAGPERRLLHIKLDRDVVRMVDVYGAMRDLYRNQAMEELLRAGARPRERYDAGGVLRLRAVLLVFGARAVSGPAAAAGDSGEDGDDPEVERMTEPEREPAGIMGVGTFWMLTCPNCEWAWCVDALVQGDSHEAHVSLSAADATCKHCGMKPYTVDLLRDGVSRTFMLDAERAS